MTAKGTKSATTGREAIEKTYEEFFNIILIDIRPPDMTGLEVLSQIKDSKPKMKKLVLTGYLDTRSARARCLEKLKAHFLKCSVRINNK